MGHTRHNEVKLQENGTVFIADGCRGMQIGYINDKSGVLGMETGCDWMEQYSMQEFRDLILENSDYGLEDLLNECKTVLSLQLPVVLQLKYSGNTFQERGLWVEWSGEIELSSVLAQMLLDTY